MSSDGTISFISKVVDTQQAKEMIANGDYMIIAGDEKVLSQLPSGNWIAGTIPYFMSSDGGKVDQDQLYINVINGCSANNPPRLTLYDVNSIPRVAQEAPEHGLTILIVPANSQVHSDYAQNSPEYRNMFFSPIMGWVAGTHLDDIGDKTAKVGFGPAAGLLSDTQAAAIHVPLPEHQIANIKIVNLFQQGNGAAITFEKNGFNVESCTVNGSKMNFAQYVKDNNIDTRLPLVANYSGVMVNVSIQEVLENEVNLYAPVYPDVEYKFAKPMDDYISEFDTALPATNTGDIAYSCNCILNFLYCELEGKKTGTLTGPMTFGEIAYQLLNQTLVYMTLEKA